MPDNELDEVNPGEDELKQKDPESGELTDDGRHVHPDYKFPQTEGDKTRGL